MVFFINIISAISFSEYSEHYGYIGIFIFFIIIDQLTPLPEEVTLLTIGYLSSNHIFNPFIAGIVSLSAFITVDAIYFYLSKTGSKFIKKRIINQNNSLANRYKQKLKNHFAVTLLVLCFIPRMRMFGPIFSGLMNLSFKKFVFFDLIGLSVFTSLYITLGFIFHNSIHLYLTKLETVQNILFAVVLILITIFIIMFVRKIQKK